MSEKNRLWTTVTSRCLKARETAAAFGSLLPTLLQENWTRQRHRTQNRWGNRGQNRGRPYGFRCRLKCVPSSWANFSVPVLCVLEHKCLKDLCGSRSVRTELAVYDQRELCEFRDLYFNERSIKLSDLIPTSWSRHTLLDYPDQHDIEFLLSITYRSTPGPTQD